MLRNYLQNKNYSPEMIDKALFMAKNDYGAPKPMARDQTSEFGKKFGNLFFSPRKFFSSVRSESAWKSFMWYIITLVVITILSYAISLSFSSSMSPSYMANEFNDGSGYPGDDYGYYAPPTGLSTAIGASLVMLLISIVFVLGIVVVMIGICILHLIIKLFGSKSNLPNTFKALFLK